MLNPWAFILLPLIEDAKRHQAEVPHLCSAKPMGMHVRKQDHTFAVEWDFAMFEVYPPKRHKKLSRFKAAITPWTVSWLKFS